MGHPTTLFLTPPDPNLRCAICLDIFSRPTSLLTCSHTFCADCLARLSSPSCPECRTATRDTHQVAVLTRAIDNLHVRCRNAYLDDHCHAEEYCPQECAWTGPLGQWAMHAAQECPVEICSCTVCGYKCPRGQMKGHLGSVDCVEGAVLKRTVEMEQKVRNETDRSRGLQQSLEVVTCERQELEWKWNEERDQNRMLVEQNAWLRHSKETQKKTSQIKIARLKREKKELTMQVALLEQRVQQEREVQRGRSRHAKKKPRSSSTGSSTNSSKRIRAVSNGHELEVHAMERL